MATIWTYDVEVYNELNGHGMIFEYDYDLGIDEEDEDMTPEDLEGEIIEAVLNDLSIIPRFLRSSKDG